MGELGTLRQGVRTAGSGLPDNSNKWMLVGHATQELLALSSSVGETPKDAAKIPYEEYANGNSLAEEV